MFLSHLECTDCDQTAQADGLLTVCPECGRPWVARYDLDRARESLTRAHLAESGPGSSRGTDLWRWREVLPLPDPSRAVRMGEGGTPLLDLPRLSGELGVRLSMKDESQNPTGSFKDRGMTVAVSMARHFGARALAAPSAGNAGGSLAAYGARAGLPVHIAMPKDVPLANRIEAEACGANVTLIDGTIADCGKWLAGQREQGGWFDLSTLKEPYRVEGKKTMGYELAEQRGWRLPDAILYPTGGGTGLVGMWKAFGEMRELGLLEADAPLPKMIAVQASGCSPVVDAFHAGTEEAQAPDNPHTIASGLRVPTPIGDRWMLRVLRESGGHAFTIDDDTLIEATRRLGRAEGRFAAPRAAPCSRRSRSRWSKTYSNATATSCCSTPGRG